MPEDGGGAGEFEDAPDPPPQAVSAPNVTRHDVAARLRMARVKAVRINQVSAGIQKVGVQYRRVTLNFRDALSGTGGVLARRPRRRPKAPKAAWDSRVNPRICLLPFNFQGPTATAYGLLPAVVPFEESAPPPPIEYSEIELLLRFATYT